jgi:hypothetical protein
MATEVITRSQNISLIDLDTIINCTRNDAYDNVRNFTTLTNYLLQGGILHSFSNNTRNNINDFIHTLKQDVSNDTYDNIGDFVLSSLDIGNENNDYGNSFDIRIRNFSEIFSSTSNYNIIDYLDAIETDLHNLTFDWNDIYDKHKRNTKTLSTIGVGIGVSGILFLTAISILTLGAATPLAIAGGASCLVGGGAAMATNQYTHGECVRSEEKVQTLIEEIKVILKLCLNDIKGNLTSTRIIKSQFNLKVQEIKDVCRNKIQSRNSCEERKRDKVNKETEIDDLKNNITLRNDNITRINAEIRILNEQKENIEAQSYNENPDTFLGGSRADVRNENLNSNDNYNNIILNINNKLTEIMNLENEISTFNRSIIEKRGELRVLDRDYNTLLDLERRFRERYDNIDNKYDELEEIKNRLLSRLNASTIIRN